MNKVLISLTGLIPLVFLSVPVNVQAQLRVDVEDDQVALWVENRSPSSSTRWGIFTSSEGTGTGIRYGIVGQAQNSTGAKYGVYGQTSGTGTRYAVYANGDIAYTGTISDVSDQKYKQNIESFTALERLLRLQPKTYQMKNTEGADMQLAEDKQRYGFIAQDLERVFPELVTHNTFAAPPSENGAESEEPVEYLGVEYMGIIPILTQALQEQQELIKAQELQLELLLARNNRLESSLNGLAGELRTLSTQVSSIKQTVPESQLVASGDGWKSAH